MAAFKVKKLWTVFITAFFAVLASLGLTSPAAAAGSAVQQPVEQPVPAPAAAQPVERTEAEAEPARAYTPRTAAASRDRSLPPTIKQRINAEAHGSSPSVRHLPAGAGTPGAADAEAARASAHAADAALVAA
ncbi:DUF6344 domain-containing protein [Streptomyces lushanensis]|uniref:DUF6344 domain-containing protein n=1 Tax=Streptomyces lushanensis TaxID=1434255 RepID=UPI0008301C78|nr:DUF6344 domain-containing protein [Streptomyces lushanensis]